MSSLVTTINNLLSQIFSIIAPLTLRIYLAVIFFYAGTRKFGNLEGFAGLVESLGFPLPIVFAFLAATAEVVGAILLLAGFGVRIASFVLIGVMSVAFFVHAPNGFLAIADGTAQEISYRLEIINLLIETYGYKDWLLEHGRVAILQNGVQFVIIYTAMLASLVHTGGGRLVSVDYWLNKNKES